MTTDTKLAKRAPTGLEKWKEEIFHERTMANLGKALTGTGFAPERFAHTAYMLVARNERLLVNKGQLWLGVYAAAECGLSLQPHMQQMHLVPFGSEVTPIIGYQGFTYLVSKAAGGLITPPVLVFQRDVEEHRFRYREGTKAVCELDPVVRNRAASRGELLYAFTTYRAPSGVVTFKCMEREALLERRERSKGWQAFKSGKKKSSPWNITHLQDGSEGGDWLAMCSKTVIRDFAKSLPKSTDHWGERAAKAEEVEAGEGAEDMLREVLDVTVEEESKKTAKDRLRDALGASGEMTEQEKQEAIAAEYEAAKQ